MSINSKYKEMSKNLVSTIHYGELPDEAIENILDVVSIAKPTNILEIGFRRGCSALMWLLADPNTKVHSIDIYVNDDNHDCGSRTLLNHIANARIAEEMSDVTKSIDYLENEFPDRFSFETLDSKKIIHQKYDDYIGKYDFIFIDGDHAAPGVEYDAGTSIELNPRYVFFDDYFQFSHIQSIVNEHVQNKVFEIVKTYPRIGIKSGGHCLVKIT